MNNQLYENSILSGSSCEQDEIDNPERLFNGREPNFAILTEKPEHRIIILLKGQGFSNIEIAEKTGYTNVWVGQILRQPWAKEALVREIQSTGRDEIQTFLQGAALDSLHTLVQLRDDAKVENSVRRAAADSLADRYLGKATQKVDSVTTVRTTSNDIEAVQREIEELEREEARLTGKQLAKN